jgi:hypothetical protein
MRCALFCLNANAAAGKWCNIRVNPAAPSLPLLISLVGDARQKRARGVGRRVLLLRRS